jgi:3-hydroxyisobutyrate dehydrogenase-like beta-hydroxyacid dehydrogenase
MDHQLGHRGGSVPVERVGFIGLGAMGQVIVPRLLQAGYGVVGWNRTEEKAKPLVEAGMRWAPNPRAVAEQSEVVFSIVTDGQAVREVALGPDGVLQGLPPGGVYVDMSTIDPDVSRAVAEEFRRTGRSMLDAPISGAPPTVREGRASLMVGGEPEVYERVRPVLLAIGPKVMYVGPNGTACAMKLAVNLLLMVEVIAFGEAVALAEKAGVDRAVAVEAVLNSVAASPVLGYRGPFILEGRMPDRPLADVNLQQKDMLLVLDLARRLGSPVPLAAAANELMNACRGLQLDHLDFVVAHRVYRKLGGAT